jgi:hypothetical protein
VFVKPIRVQGVIMNVRIISIQDWIDNASVKETEDEWAEDTIRDLVLDEEAVPEHIDDGVRYCFVSSTRAPTVSLRKPIQL